VPLRRVSVSIAIVATTAFVAVASGSDAGGRQAHRATPVVTVADDYYAPVNVKIKKNQKVKFKWDDFNYNTHNVTLTGTKPNGVKKGDFKSSSGAINVKFNPKFKTPGKYGFVCTLHKTVMKMTVKVTK
jgi:plastocyanin